MKKSAGSAENLSVMEKIRRFVSDTVAEMGRCTWPNRQQLLESTILVVVAMSVLACFVAAVDEVAMRLIRLVTVGNL